MIWYEMHKQNTYKITHWIINSMELFYTFRPAVFGGWLCGCCVCELLINVCPAIRMLYNELSETEWIRWCGMVIPLHNSYLLLPTTIITIQRTTTEKSKQQKMELNKCDDEMKIEDEKFIIYTSEGFVLHFHSFPFFFETSVCLLLSFQQARPWAQFDTKVHTRRIMNK